jgi:hypothetical protein
LAQQPAWRVELRTVQAPCPIGSRLAPTPLDDPVDQLRLIVLISPGGA